MNFLEAASQHDIDMEGRELSSRSGNTGSLSDMEERAKFFGINILPKSSSESPSIGNLFNNSNPAYTKQINPYINYAYKYISGSLSDLTFKVTLEKIMTSAIRGESKYLPIQEYQTFTKEGECIFVLKYMEQVEAPKEETPSGKKQALLSELSDNITTEDPHDDSYVNSTIQKGHK